MSRFQSVTCDKAAFPREFNDLVQNVTYSKRDKWVQGVTKPGAADLPRCKVAAFHWEGDKEPGGACLVFND
jgi:hypothetical protein